MKLSSTYHGQRRAGCATAWMLLVAFSGRAPAELAAQEPEPPQPTLVDVVAPLKTWRDSFVNLDLTWEMRTIQSEALRKAQEAGPEQAAAFPSPFSRERWIWADYGLSVFENTNFVGGESGFTKVWNAAKNISFRIHYVHDPARGKVMEKLEVGGISNSRPISWDSRLPLTGLYFNWTTKWLHEHLPEWKVTLDGYEEIDGHRCLRVLPAELEGETLWLDVEHDFLVRRYLSPSIPDRRQGRDFLVQEFRRLDTGIWFPVRGTTTTFRRIPDVYEWRVTSVTVNGEVNAAAWMPPRPEVGAFVSDLRTGMVRRVAHEGERTEIERKILEAAQKNLAARPLQSYQTQTSPISSALWWSMGLLGVAVVLLLAAKMFSKRSTYPARRNEA